MAQSGPIARCLAEWVAALEPADIPAPVLHAAKRCIVDTVAVAIGGSAMTSAKHVRAHVERHYPGNDATILGTDARSSAVGAALANGMAAHVLDFDDTSYAGIIHGSTVILPSVLAAAEERRVSGRAFLSAFVAASEATYGLGLTLTESHYMKGWWASGTIGVIGAAAGAAKLLDLDAERMAACLGLTALQASGMVASLGTDAKPFQAGRNAMVGIESAYLAKDGFAGPVGIFEDRRGFLALMNDGAANMAALSELGRVWRLIEPGILFKRYPVCSAAQAACEVTERLISDNELTLDGIDNVQCDVTELVAISLIYDRPKTPPEAQFSMPFAIGSILVDGHLGPEHLTAGRLRDPRLEAAMAKVTMARADDLDTVDMRARYPEGARVTITTLSGQRYSDYLGAPTGMPETPLSDAALGDKLRSCAAFAGWEEPKAANLLARLWALDEVTDMTELFVEDGT